MASCCNRRPTCAMSRRSSKRAANTPGSPKRAAGASWSRHRPPAATRAAIFLGVMWGAGARGVAGWQPAGRKNNGELLQPPTDLRDVTPQLEAGGEYAWKPEARRWRILVAPPADCGDPCRELARELDLVWRLFGNKADELDILWLGAPPDGATRNAATLVLSPDPALRAKLPRVDDPAGVPVYVVDPNGFVILRYAPGFDPGGLRADVAKLLRLM